jgi:alpha-tubulin suppressor-like RCC1 family protein
VRPRGAWPWAALVAGCGAATPDESTTTVRVQVSVQEAPAPVVLVATPAPSARRVVAAARPSQPSPAPVTCGFARDASAPRASFAEVSLGHGHSCARIGDGTVRCWGWNLDGETGNGATGSDRGPAAPAQVRDVEGAAQVCAGFSYSCARLRDGTAECWGNNSNNQIRFSLRASCTAEPVRSPVDHVRALACGGWHVCALRDNGSVWCWGEEAPRYAPWQVRLPGRAVEVVAGWHRSCARTAAGAVFCWTVTAREPVAVQGFASPPVQLAVAERFACAALADGTAACWGDGYHGELGNGAPRERREAAAVAGLSDVREVSAHEGRACALTADGAIWCWGQRARHGRRGRDADDEIVGPTRLTAVGPAEHLYVGERHACAHTRVGDLCCWGDNTYGQLGNNRTGSSSDPDAPSAVVW